MWRPPEGLQRQGQAGPPRRGGMAGRNGEHSVARGSPNRRFPLLLPGAVRPALSARITRSVKTLGYAAIANASLSLAFRVFETFNGLFMPGKSSRLSTHVDPGSTPHPPDNGSLWWSRRVLPPGPLHLFHDAIYRHRRAEARQSQCRGFSRVPQGFPGTGPVRRR